MISLLLPTALLSIATHVAPVARSLPPAVTLDTTLAVPATTRIILDLKSGGSVKITGGSDKVVRVRVTEGGRECKDCNVQLEQTSQGLQVRSSAGSGSSKLRFEIEVPSHFDVDLASTGGEVQIEGVDGAIKGQTGSGDLTLRRLSGDVDLQTMRGDVTLKESYVSGRVSSAGGRVLLEDVSGSVQGAAVGGKVTERRVTRN
ncbi:MAG TPA: hypothetical protein VGP25_01970 [Gemmatimonadaceae bacterium]|jgi:DUF4097 and DUF4098 domain-containing protein YvlB|nr:hypothetical protein [Gemmatimonadaceae bacterium]